MRLRIITIYVVSSECMRTARNIRLWEHLQVGKWKYARQMCVVEICAKHSVDWLRQ